MKHAISQEQALWAARVATWRWDRGAERFHLHSGRADSLKALDGEWGMVAFLGQLDPFSRDAMAKTLKREDGGMDIDVSMTLSDGGRVQFVGERDVFGNAFGIAFGENNYQGLSETHDVVAVFQPIFRVEDMSLVGFEALARFRGVDGELIGPEGLADISQKADWAVIGPRMIAQAAELLRGFQDRGRLLFVQVNLSAAEMGQADLIEEIAAALRAADLESGTLRIELTEQAALRDHGEALGALAALKSAGAGLVLDDFGAGHSSLVWLSELPMDGAKLDSDLTEIHRTERGMKILKAMVALLKDLGLTVTAEGVDARDMIPILRDMGVDQIQGFALGDPMTREGVISTYSRRASD